MDSNTPKGSRDTLREIISKLTVDQHLQIMREYDQYEKDGAIGESLLRTTAEQVQDLHFAGMILFVMHEVAFETYRYIAKCQQRHYAGYVWAMN
jgi:predicted SprT family Zn-dependent metalloprotease